MPASRPFKLPEARFVAESFASVGRHVFGHGLNADLKIPHALGKGPGGRVYGRQTVFCVLYGIASHS